MIISRKWPWSKDDIMPCTFCIVLCIRLTKEQLMNRLQTVQLWVTIYQALSVTTKYARPINHIFNQAYLFAVHIIWFLFKLNSVWLAGSRPIAGTLDFCTDHFWINFLSGHSFWCQLRLKKNVIADFFGGIGLLDLEQFQNSKS